MDSLREKCPNTEFFWSVFSYNRSEYRKIRTRKNFVFGHFSRSAGFFVIGTSIIKELMVNYFRQKLYDLKYASDILAYVGNLESSYNEAISKLLYPTKFSFLV